METLLLMTTKFTPLEIEIILDRPEECIVECSCQFYTEEMVAKHGDRNKTENIITEIWEGQERKVYPEQKVWNSCDKIRWSLEDHKKIICCGNILVQLCRGYCRPR